MIPEVTDLIPHRERWLLLERIVEVDLERGTLVAVGRFDEDYVRGHFPGQPVVPGVALLEALSQTLACLARMTDPEAEGTPFLAAFDRVRFRAPVLPPAEVRYHVRFQERRMGLTSAVGEARCDGRKVCTARLIGAVAPSDLGR